MSVEDFSKYKRKKTQKASTQDAGWLNSVYNPKIFRRKKDKEENKNEKRHSYEYKVMAYIGILSVVMVFILAYAVLKKNGLVD